MAKSASVGVMHLGIGFGVTDALTGNRAVAGAVTVQEPVCNTVAQDVVDRWWEARHPRGATATAELAAAGCGGESRVG